MGLNKLPDNELFAKGLACGSCLPSAINVSPKGITGQHSDNMWYDKANVACHFGELGIV